MTFKHGSKLFCFKFGQNLVNHVDGTQTNGEQWGADTRTYFIGIHPPMKYFLAWAEKRGAQPITPASLEPLRDWLHEDPVVVSHLLWDFLAMNLTGVAKAIHASCQESDGFVVWRRVVDTIPARAVRRKDELYTKIQDP